MKALYVTGHKTIPMGKAGWKERDTRGFQDLLDSAESHTITPFSECIYVQTGKEETPIVAAGGIKCFVGKHTIKNKTNAYDCGPKPQGIGNFYVCEEHFRKLPTLELAIYRLETTKYILDCTVIDGNSRETVYEKRQEDL